MHSQKEIDLALETYHQCGSVRKTIRILGYPSCNCLYKWIGKEGAPKPPRKKLSYINTPQHRRNPSHEVKINALHRCFELGESVKSVSEEIGYTRISIYNWRKEYLQGGSVALMNNRNIQPDTLVEGHAPTIQATDLEKLQAQIKDMQLEMDILKETINVIKKDPGINQTSLKNREKAVIVDALKDQYSLPTLLKMTSLSKSSYYYQETVLKQKDKYSEVRKRIKELFHTNRDCYGYRRIYGVLKREGITLSEKIVRRIMHEEGLTIKSKRRKKYSSYQGELSPSVPNVLERDFHADRPNEKWLTDITEFALPDGKVYLSQILDCFDGMVLSWTIGTCPDAKLVNDMLDQAIAGLGKGEHPIVHSDRGCHYRWPGWIERMEQAGLKRSMSKKGCSPDNSACEGLFGRLKNEMFYNTVWTEVSIPKFIDILEEYLVWYNEKRIKVSLKNMSPKEYRQGLGLIALN